MTHYQKQQKTLDKIILKLQSAQALSEILITQEREAPCPDDADYFDFKSEIDDVIETAHALWGALDVMIDPDSYVYSDKKNGE